MDGLSSKLRQRLQTSPITRPAYYGLRAMKRFGQGLLAFGKSLLFVGRRIVPVIVAHGQRPVLLAAGWERGISSAPFRRRSV